MANKTKDFVEVKETKRADGRVRRRTRIFFDEEKGVTKQAFKDECDINNILMKYDRQGIGLLELQAQNPGLYGDFSDVGSFQEAQNIIVAANAQFAALSASVRERFGNDPANFLKFMENPEENLPEMIKLGLADRVPEKETTLQDVQKTLQERLPLPDSDSESPRQQRSKRGSD